MLRGVLRSTARRLCAAAGGSACGPPGEAADDTPHSSVVVPPETAPWSLRATLARQLYAAHYCPTTTMDADAESLGWRAAKTEVRWLVDWAEASIPPENGPSVSQTDNATSRRRAALKQAVHERVVLKKPLSYVIGWQPFLDARIECEPPVLIPRPETEQWALWLTKKLSSIVETGFFTPRRRIRVLDLCAGSGCVGIALAQSSPLVDVVAVDICPAAVRLCTLNARRNGLGPARVQVVQGDMFAPLLSRRDHTLTQSGDDGGTGGLVVDGFDLVVSNPPYIRAEALLELPETITRWESRLALVGDATHADRPRSYYEEIVRLAPRVLRGLDSSEILRGGQSHGAGPQSPRTDGPTTRGLPHVVVELGDSDADHVSTMFGRAGYNTVEVHADWAGTPRWIAAWV